jgi:hypothetical protein
MGRIWLPALGALAILIASVFLLPRILYPPLSEQDLIRQGVTVGRERIELIQQQGRLQNDARGILLQGFGGGVLLLGAYFTWRQLQTTREQLYVAEQGQLTERFTRAIDHLGSEHLDIRLGGIYALERIARDSLADRVTIAEVLTAYIRGHASPPPDPPGRIIAGVVFFNELPSLQVSAPDVQAALTVLGRGGFAAAVPARLDLIGANLRRAQAAYAQLYMADLHGAQLQAATLFRAQLKGAYLADAQLQEANLVEAQLQEAMLARANLERSSLFGANLEGAYLDGAELGGANLERAQLRKAILTGANLHSAKLDGAQLHGAQASRATTWPYGFDPQAQGVLLVEDQGVAGVVYGESPDEADRHSPWNFRGR